MRKTTSKEERRAAAEASRQAKHGKAGRPYGSFTKPGSVSCRIPSHHYRAVMLIAKAKGETFVECLGRILSQAIPVELGDSELRIDPRHVL